MSENGARSRHKFLIHKQGDHVGVATSPIASGEQVLGVFMDDDSTIEVEAKRRHPDRAQDRHRGAGAGGRGARVRDPHRQGAGGLRARRLRPHAQHQEREVVGVPTDQLLGYRRENGTVGVRNHVVILPIDDISNAACEAVASHIKGTLALPHAYGRLQYGEDLDLHFRTHDRHGREPQRGRRRRDRHRAQLDQARRRRDRRDRQAGGVVLDRGPRRPRDRAAGVVEGQGVRPAGLRASSASRSSCPS